MKLELVKDEKKEFKPVTLTIKIESAEEYAMIKYMSGMSLSIPGNMPFQFKESAIDFLSDLWNLLESNKQEID